MRAEAPFSRGSSLSAIGIVGGSKPDHFTISSQTRLALPDPDGVKPEGFATGRGLPVVVILGDLKG